MYRFRYFQVTHITLTHQGIQKYYHTSTTLVQIRVYCVIFFHFYFKLCCFIRIFACSRNSSFLGFISRLGLNPNHLFSYHTRSVLRSAIPWILSKYNNLPINLNGTSNTGPLLWIPWIWVVLPIELKQNKKKTDEQLPRQIIFSTRQRQSQLMRACF